MAVTDVVLDAIALVEARLRQDDEALAYLLREPPGGRRGPGRCLRPAPGEHHPGPAGRARPGAPGSDHGRKRARLALPLAPRPLPDRPATGRCSAAYRHVPGRAAAAHIRTMITLGQQGGKHRAEVDKLARDLR